MLVRQSKNSYIRCTDKYGYINDQLTRQDRVYDEIGALFLKQITLKNLKNLHNFFYHFANFLI